MATSIRHNPPPDLDEYIDALKARGEIVETDGINRIYSTRFLQYGADFQVGDFKSHRLRHEFLLKASETKSGREVPEYEFLIRLGAVSLSALFLKDRLGLLDSSDGFDPSKGGCYLSRCSAIHHP